MRTFTIASNVLLVELADLGARILRLETPDRTGRRANVVLGCPTPQRYAASTAYFGATIGRFANRIAGGRFTLDGRAYRIASNEGENALHGGARGFDRAVWSLASAAERTVVFRHESPDGDQGFPGRLRCEVAFSVAGETLSIAYVARTDAPTIVSLTNHVYFNLAGEGAGDVYDHDLEIAADAFVPIDAAGIPLGGTAPVAGTPFDFRASRRIGDRLRDAHPQIVNGYGYDHAWVLGAPDERRPCARVFAARSGRILECRTDRPALQFYAGNRLDGREPGTDGTHLYRQGDGFALETQAFPDAPNRPEFPAATLRPGETFRSRTSYRFTTDARPPAPDVPASK